MLQWSQFCGCGGGGGSEPTETVALIFSTQSHEGPKEAANRRGVVITPQRLSRAALPLLNVTAELNHLISVECWHCVVLTSTRSVSSHSYEQWLRCIFECVFNFSGSESREMKKYGKHFSRHSPRHFFCRQ